MAQAVEMCVLRQYPCLSWTLILMKDIEDHDYDEDDDDDDVDDAVLPVLESVWSRLPASLSQQIT